MTSILLTGRNGCLGAELYEALPRCGQIVAPDRSQMDLADHRQIRDIIRAVRPDIIVNAAAYTAVDRAEHEPQLARDINAIAPEIIAEEARRIGALLIHYSTDYVFDGARAAPYTEDDVPHPLNVYGVTKLEGEQAIAGSGCDYVVLRTSWLYGRHGRGNFVLAMLRLARDGSAVRAVTDQVGSPTWARELARGTVDLLSGTGAAQRDTGIYHLVASGYASRFELAVAAVEAARTHLPGDWARVEPAVTADFAPAARRPAQVRLSTDKAGRVLGVTMSDWRSQLNAFLGELFVTFDTLTSNRR